MSHLFSLSRYQRRCVIKFLFRQWMMSQTLRFIIDYPLKQLLTRKKDEKIEIEKVEYLENGKSFLDETKRIFHN